MTYRIAVDTGGTFTDIVVTDGRGALWAEKAPTTPDDVFAGVEDALGVTAESMDISLEELLSHCGLLTYATTHATNAIIVGETARTALLTTAGFPDTLVLREGGKLGPFDYSRDYPDPYVPRSLTFEIEERITSEGEVFVPFNREQALEVLALFEELEVEAVAVCLLWSIANPAHELAMGELLAERLPGVPFTLSHQIAPVIREYRRASAASIDASLKPLMTRHFESVARRLRARGFRGGLLVVTSTGGVMPIEDVVRRPLFSVGSGPSIGPVGGLAAARDEEVGESLIVCDMGGTSFDVSVVRDGAIQFARETWLGGQFTGHLTGLSSIAVRSIGYGGGSIAWIDDGGLLRVGPRSAGSQPGPAAYGRGGREPTVTDAAVVLGYIDPAVFLGGRMTLDGAAAEAAIRDAVAGPLELDVDRAAAAVLALAVDNMAAAISEITVNQGLDPRECILVGGGGASGLCVAAIAAQLGCRRALVPATAAVLSATGGLYSDVVTEVSASYATDTGEFDLEGVNGVLAELDGAMDEFLGRVGRNGEGSEKQFLVEARYRYQVWELEVPLVFDRFGGGSEVERLEGLFHEAHERVFGVREPGQRVECLYWSGRARARLPTPEAPTIPLRTAPAEPRGLAEVYFPQAGRVLTPRYRGLELPPGQALPGPAVIELPTTTIVVYLGSTALRTRRGNFLLEVASPGEVDLVPLPRC